MIPKRYVDYIKSNDENKHSEVAEWAKDYLGRFRWSVIMHNHPDKDVRAFFEGMNEGSGRDIGKPAEELEHAEAVSGYAKILAERSTNIFHCRNEDAR